MTETRASDSAEDIADQLRATSATLAALVEQGTAGPRRSAVPWIVPAALSWAGTMMLVAAIVLLATGRVGWLEVALMLAGGPLGMVVLFVPAEGPYWKRG